MSGGYRNMNISKIGKQSSKEVLNELAKGTFAHAELRSIAKRLTVLVPGLENSSVSKVVDTLLTNDSVMKGFAEATAKDIDEREVIDIKAPEGKSLYELLAVYPEFQNAMVVWRDAIDDNSNNGDIDPGDIKKLSDLKVEGDTEVDEALYRVMQAVIVNEDEELILVHEGDEEQA